ncbi:MAG: DNA-3-methyladenine glycosylase 2 family protein, partial [Oscillospiraceae bacterium]|nr:DNA-3-methyladenine glycosylase 2 family protein [Oscillospiraceae bacterium]
NYLEILQDGDKFILLNATEFDYTNIWYKYFDLGKNYNYIKDTLSTDITMRKAVEFSPGMRLLRQDSWEALVSFIISQNNNIKRIKGILKNICQQFNRFPTPRDIYDNDLSPFRLGFRDKYLKDCAEKILSGEVNLDKNTTAEDLKKIYGVGDKVAACVLLYGLYKTEAFPVDVWIKKAVKEYYPNGFPKEFFDIQGIAQLYLFNFIRKVQNVTPVAEILQYVEN